MKKLFFCLLIIVAACMSNGCGSVHRTSSETMGPEVYRISAWSTSRKVLAETVERATERCNEEGKKYLFVKNIFEYSCNLGIDMISYELYFSCVDPGDPRLKEWKPMPRPVEQKVDQVVEEPKQQVVPDKGKSPAQEQASPGPGEMKPVVIPDEEASPKVSEEQRRKGNPGMGEPEALRKDGLPLCDEAGKNIRIIEEPLYDNLGVLQERKTKGKSQKR